MLKKLLRLTNRRVRLLVGLLLAGLFCVQCAPSDAGREAQDVKFIPEQLGDEIEHLAKTDHIALLQRCIDHYDKNYYDYTCTFIKQEMIRGRWGKQQWIDVKFRDKPFSVAMKWTLNPPMGDRVLYVEGQWDDMMLVRPKGAIALLFPTVKRKPDEREVLQNTLRPVSMFGFKRGMQSLLKVYTQAKKAGHLKQSFGKYAEIDGRKTIILVRYLPPKNDYPAWETKTYIDLEYLVPIRLEGKNWDKKPNCAYQYKNIQFNVGLKDDAFRPEANDLKDTK